MVQITLCAYIYFEIQRLLLDENHIQRLK
uniref:Uncharacterized protein n=1 Tax=Nelumbo nucifera TaxID=4432 RepID=A0A822YB43_NELNU|nr:TPA_asm: hypothetical protein HUJ06_029713 [Nelumbo nucifera]